MTNEKHISIDRDQYELQVAELCDLRAKLALLYDPTPITSEWLEACGGTISERQCAFPGGGWATGHKCGSWELEDMGASNVIVRTRGEFRRAAELLGIELVDRGPIASNCYPANYFPLF